MRVDVLVWILHGLVVWVVVRMLGGLAVSSGAQSLWGLAGAVTVAVLASTLVTAWLTRTHRTATRRLLWRLLPVPLAGGAWTGAVVLGNGGRAAQVGVAGGSWLLGGGLALLVLGLVADRAQRRRSDLTSTFGRSREEQIRW